MNKISEKISDYIKGKRPSLSTGSLKTYTSIIRNLYEKIFLDDLYDLEKFGKVDQVLMYLRNIKRNTRKTYLSALIVVTDGKIQEYKDMMKKDVNKYIKEMEKQEKSESQKINWITPNEIKLIYKMYQNNFNLLMKKSKEDLTKEDILQMRDFVIIAVMGGEHIEPRRLKDYVDMKIKNVDKDKDNYIDDKFQNFVFNSYKTAKFYGLQKLKIPIKLKNILIKWLKINPTDFLFFDSNQNQLVNVQLNQVLNKIFSITNKNISVNILRHVYLTDRYGSALNGSILKHKKSIDNDIFNTMKNMGSSQSMITTYVKND